MKRKTTGKAEKVVADEILKSARLAAGVDTKRKETCSVCNAEVAPNSSEPLCWVCRRLKISAWRDADLQASAPE
jgi:hypothetical protein